jgi:hypothetical protein
MADHTGKSTSIWCVKVPIPQRSTKLSPSSNEATGDGDHDRTSRRPSPPPPSSLRKGEQSSSSAHELRDDATSHITISSKISQPNESFARELIALTEVFELDPSPLISPIPRHPEVHLLHIVSHESYEATSMELRVSVSTRQGGGSGIGETGGMNSGASVLYIGTATGVIQKHTIHDLAA